MPGSRDESTSSKESFGLVARLLRLSRVHRRECFEVFALQVVSWAWGF